MVTADKCNNVANTFKLESSKILEECVHGIGDLGRIIVNSSSAIVDKTRGYLVPSLYAYWERYFSLSLTQALILVFREKIYLYEVNCSLSRSYFVWLMQTKLINQGIRDAGLAYDKFNEEGLQNFGTELNSIFTSDINEEVLRKLIDCESNLSLNEIKKNMKRVGFSIKALEDNFGSARPSIYEGLNNLITLRNEIAHGERLAEVNAETWETLQSFVKNASSV